MTDITDAAGNIAKSRSEDHRRHNNRLDRPEELKIGDWVLLHEKRLAVVHDVELKAK